MKPPTPFFHRPLGHVDRLHRHRFGSALAFQPQMRWREDHMAIWGSIRPNHQAFLLPPQAPWLILFGGLNMIQQDYLPVLHSPLQRWIELALCPNITVAALRHRVLAPSREDVADLSQVALRNHWNLPIMDARHTCFGCGSQQRIYAPLQSHLTMATIFQAYLNLAPYHTLSPSYEHNLW